MKKKQTIKAKNGRAKTRLPRRVKRRITAAQARRIAMLHDGILRFRGATVKSGRERGIDLLYDVGERDCWIVYPQSIGQPARVGASYLICVDKRSGKVFYAGMAGE